MKKYSLLVISSLLLAGTACSTAPKYAPDPSLTRNRAQDAYSELDETAYSGNTQKPSGNSTAAQNTAAEQPISQPTIMVMPAKNIDQDESSMSVAMIEAINGYLTQKRYEVKSLEGETQLDNIIKMQNDIANTEDDMSYLASLALGADVYIKCSGSVQTSNVVVEVSAYETSTARLLGSQTAEVKNNGHTNETNLRANMQSAARKAMPNLEKKILAYWKMDLAKGSQYKVVMNLKSDFTDSQIEELQDNIVKDLKNTFNSITVNVMTNKTIDLIVYADPARFSDSQEVYSEIRQLLKAFAETKKINITKKLILMDVL